MNKIQSILFLTALGIMALVIQAIQHRIIDLEQYTKKTGDIVIMQDHEIQVLKKQVKAYGF